MVPHARVSAREMESINVDHTFLSRTISIASAVDFSRFNTVMEKAIGLLKGPTILHVQLPDRLGILLNNSSKIHMLSHCDGGKKRKEKCKEDLHDEKGRDELRGFVSCVIAGVCELVV